jgi:transcriptional regulator with XRE-family HTH domain
MAKHQKLDAHAIGRRIANARKAKGLTGEKLADVIGITKSAVSQWETGQTFPDFKGLVGLCVELQVSADFIIWGDTTRALSATERKLVELFRAERPNPQ